MAKTTPNKPKPLTEEEKRLQVERFLANKKEQFFTIILSNLLQNPNVTHETLVTVSGAEFKERRNVNILEVVDAAADAADYALERLYKPQEGEK